MTVTDVSDAKAKKARSPPACSQLIQMKYGIVNIFQMGADEKAKPAVKPKGKVAPEPNSQAVAAKAKKVPEKVLNAAVHKPTAKAAVPKPTAKAAVPKPTAKAAVPKPTAKAAVPKPPAKAAVPKPPAKAAVPKPTAKAA